MSIFCLEGASAVGKTTACRVLEERPLFDRVPEVNELFARPKNEPRYWYLECQVKRWKIAKKISESARIALLDGDPFQAIWYNWVYPKEGRLPLNDILAFYEEKILQGDIEFPQKYILLKTSLSNLKTRKGFDATRKRRGFDKHLKCIGPQQQYFTKMNTFSEGLVSFIESDSSRNVASKISAMTTQQDYKLHINSLYPNVA